MAQPPAYNREKNFTLNSGRETDHVALNAELDRASNSINDIRSNLAILQADDGKLRPFVVTPDSISEELRVSLVEGVVMDAQAMLDESKAASKASADSAEKGKASETAAAASALAALNEADRAADIADGVQAKADEIVQTSTSQAQAHAEVAARSAQDASESATQAQAVYARIEERAGEIVQTAASEAAEQAQVSAKYAGLSGKSAEEAKVHAEIANQRGIPVGTVVMFSADKPSAGYLKADGSAVGRETYPDLFAAIGTAYGEGDGTSTFNLPSLNREIGAIVPFASRQMPQDFMLCDGRAINRMEYAELFAVIGTTYGEGDGETTFNLPNLIGRFAEGSATPGTVKEAGLPNVTGYSDVAGVASKQALAGGACIQNRFTLGVDYSAIGSEHNDLATVSIDASRSNPIYGNSDTVQPPALTVCYGIRVKNLLHAAIKAFDAAVEPGLVDITELANDIRKAKTPVGTVAWFAMTAPPVGYLIANGAAVGRETYPDLYAAIGVTYGEGDGTSTFNLPNLIGRFAQGSAAPGTVKEAGLPNITGYFRTDLGDGDPSGVFYRTDLGGADGGGGAPAATVHFDASRSHSIYGKSNTVQPPALTLLPCIKAFDAAVNTGLIDVTELAQEMAGKADKTQAAHLAMPSGTGTELTIGNSGQNYTMPADGFLELVAIASGSGYTNFIPQNAGPGAMLFFPGADVAQKMLLPVRKGEIIKFNYEGLDKSATDTGMYFWYANGSQLQ